MADGRAMRRRHRGIAPAALPGRGRAGQDRPGRAARGAGILGSREWRWVTAAMGGSWHFYDAVAVSLPSPCGEGRKFAVRISGEGTLRESRLSRKPSPSRAPDARSSRR